MSRDATTATPADLVAMRQRLGRVGVWTGWLSQVSADVARDEALEQLAALAPIVIRVSVDPATGSRA
jgi:hypothetical protein